MKKREAGPDVLRRNAWRLCALRNFCTMNVGVRAKLNTIESSLQRNIDRIGELFAEGIDSFGGPWLAGENFSAVDAFFAPVAYRVRSFDLDIGAKGRAWVEHIIAHPSMHAWETEALAETHREVGHEEELAAAATITVDHRAT